MHFGKEKLTIKQEVFNIGLIFSMITFFLFGGVLCVSIYLLEINHAREIMKDVNYHMAVVAKNESKSIANTLKVLSNDFNIREAGTSDSVQIIDSAKKLYRDYYNADNNITQIYSGYINGRLVINNWIPPKDYDPTVRPWYMGASQVDDNSVVQIMPYQDIITKQWQISSSTPLYSKAGEFVGVLGIDRSVNSMSEAINEKNYIRVSITL